MPLKNRGTVRLKRGWLFQWVFFFFWWERGGKRGKKGVRIM